MARHPPGRARRGRACPSSRSRRRPRPRFGKEEVAAAPGSASDRPAIGQGCDRVAVRRSRAAPAARAAEVGGAAAGSAADRAAVGQSRDLGGIPDARAAWAHRVEPNDTAARAAEDHSLVGEGRDRARIRDPPAALPPREKPKPPFPPAIVRCWSVSSPRRNSPPVEAV